MTIKNIYPTSPCYAKYFFIIFSIFNLTTSLSSKTSGCFWFRCLNANLTLWPHNLHFALANIYVIAPLAVIKIANLNHLKYWTLYNLKQKSRFLILFRWEVVCVHCVPVICGSLTYQHCRMIFHKFHISTYFAFQQFYLTAQQTCYYLCSHCR